MANAGPIPMTSGGTPTTALALRTPRTGRPRASTADLRPISTAAAPSLTWLELPETQRVPIDFHALPPLVDPLHPPERRLTCRGAAASFEGRLEPTEPCQRGPRPDPVVLGDRHRALCAVGVHELGGDGNDLLPEQPQALRPRRSVRRQNRVQSASDHVTEPRRSERNVASTHFCWELRAKASCFSLETPNLSATFSDVMLRNTRTRRSFIPQQ